jgi:hypothetical protein
MVEDIGKAFSKHARKLKTQGIRFINKYFWLIRPSSGVLGSILIVGIALTKISPQK